MFNLVIYLTKITLELNKNKKMFLKMKKRVYFQGSHNKNFQCKLQFLNSQ